MNQRPMDPSEYPQRKPYSYEIKQGNTKRSGRLDAVSSVDALLQLFGTATDTIDATIKIKPLLLPIG